MRLLEQYEEARANRTPEQQAEIDDLHAALVALSVDDLEHDARVWRELTESGVIFVAVP